MTKVMIIGDQTDKGIAERLHGHGASGADMTEDDGNGDARAALGRRGPCRRASCAEVKLFQGRWPGEASLGLTPLKHRVGARGHRTEFSRASNLPIRAFA